MDFGICIRSWNQFPTNTEEKLSFWIVKIYMWILDFGGDGASVGVLNSYIVKGSIVFHK